MQKLLAIIVAGAFAISSGAVMAQAKDAPKDAPKADAKKDGKK